jgi:hypothetical protein
MMYTIDYEGNEANQVSSQFIDSIASAYDDLYELNDQANGNYYKNEWVCVDLKLPESLKEDMQNLNPQNYGNEKYNFKYYNSDTSYERNYIEDFFNKFMPTDASNTSNVMHFVNDLLSSIFLYNQGHHIAEKYNEAIDRKEMSIMLVHNKIRNNYDIDSLYNPCFSSNPSFHMDGDDASINANINTGSIIFFTLKGNSTLVHNVSDDLREQLKELEFGSSSREELLSNSEYDSTACPPYNLLIMRSEAKYSTVHAGPTTCLERAAIGVFLNTTYIDAGNL